MDTVQLNRDDWNELVQCMEQALDLLRLWDLGLLGRDEVSNGMVGGALNCGREMLAKMQDDVARADLVGVLPTKHPLS